MNALVPVFIYEQLSRKRNSGSGSGVCLTIDMSGFTAVTEDLMDHGKDGAEELSRLINDLFGSVVSLVYSNQGFIISFAGDALTAMFPAEDARYACSAAVATRDLIRNRRRLETRFGLYRISVRIGLGMGRFTWGIVGSDVRKAYYFSGEAIDRSLSAQAQSTNGDIIVAPGLSDLLVSRGAEIDHARDGFSVLMQSNPQGQIVQVPVTSPSFEIAVLEQLFPAEVAAWHGSGEFRQVAAVFVGLRGNPSFRELDSVVAVVAQSCELHGGYLNLLDYGDKGYVMLALFGAPTAHENDIERAADFSLAVSKELGEQVRFGLASGVAYTGLVGSPVRSTYTALGSTINLSARLMQHAPWGAICSPGSLGDRLREGYQVSSTGSIELKGFDRPVEILQVESARLITEDRFLARFVGRGAELAFLEKRISRVAHGEAAGIVYVYGEAGMGKSRLAHESVKSAGGGARHCFLETDLILRKSLNPFVEFLSSFFSLPEEQPARTRRFDEGYSQLLREVEAVSRDERATQMRGALERYKPFIGVPLGAHAGGTLYDELDPQARFENTVYAITELFRALCLISPLVLVIEDVQALDHDSTELFAYLLRNLSHLPVAVIVTSRFADDGSKPALHPNDLTDVEELSLGPLDLESIGELLAERIGGPVDQDTLGLIFEKTQGNPFYAEQFAVYLKETRRLVPNGEVFSLTTDLSEVPVGVNGLLIARLDRLSPALRSVTQVASVFGQQFRQEILCSIMGSPATGNSMGRSEVLECLGQGRLQRLWTEVGEDSFVFQSTLLRDAAYDMQSTERIRWLHRVAAYALEVRLTTDETRFADLAYHFRIGGAPGKAAHYLRRAAEFAASNFKNDDAIEFYRTLLDFVDPHEQIEVRLRMAEVSDVQGDWKTAIEQMRIGLDLAKRIVRPQEEAQILVKAGEIYQKQGDYERAERTLRSGVEHARRIGDRQCYGGSLLFLGRTYWSTGKYDSGIKLLNLAADTLESTGDTQGVALALYYTGVIYRDKGDYRTATEYYRRSEVLFGKVGNRRLETYPLYDLAVLFLYRGELQQAFEYFADVVKVYREIGYKSGLAAALGNLGTISAYQGRFDKAGEFESEAFEIVNAIGEQLAIAYGLFNRGLQAYLRGDHQSAVSIFTQSLALMRRIGAGGYYGYVQSYAACSLAHLERYSESLAQSRDHLARIAESGSDVENGRSHLAVALVLSLSKGNLDAESKRLLGEIVDIAGLPSNADDFFEEAVRRAERASYIATMITGYAQFGGHLIRKSDSASRARGAEYLRKAVDLAERTTMLYSIDQIRSILREGSAQK